MTVPDTATQRSKNIGAANLVEELSKLNLSPEVREFLANLNARLVVTFSSGSTRPDLEIQDKRGTLVCSIDEFVKLGSFRRWVNDELKAIDKITASSDKLKLIALFFRKASEKGSPIPDRMDDANETKFKQFHSMVKIVLSHIEVIEDTIENDARAYLLEKANLVVEVIYKLMLDCVTSKVEKEAYNDALYERGVPKWLANRLVDKQFTSNLKVDSINLMFPKGNYLKSIALMTKEILNEGFLTANRFAVEHSGSIIALAKADLGFMLPDIPKHVEGEIVKYIDEYMWTMISPYTAAEILQLRINGKAIPSFRSRQKANPRPGAKSRPETESQRISREIHNLLGEVVSTWLHLQNLVIPCAQPLQDFWSRIIPGTNDWEMTPNHGLYMHIKESGVSIDSLKDLSNEILLQLMAEIVTQAIRVPTGSDNGKKIIAIFKGMKGHPRFQEFEKALDTNKRLYDVDVSAMEKVELPEKILDETKKFLGQMTSKKKASKKISGQAAVRLHTSVLDELTLIEGLDIYPKVKEWLSTSFKTGNFKATQLLAARMVAGEVLKYKDKLLDEDFDEYDYLENLEEDEDSDN